MSSHRHIRLLLYDYAAGQLEAERRTLVQRHLEGCLECREECTELRTMLEGLPAESNPSANLPPAFWQGLLNDVSARLPDRPKRRIIPAWISDWIEFISLPRHQVIVEQPPCSSWAPSSRECGLHTDMNPFPNRLPRQLQWEQHHQCL